MELEEARDRVDRMQNVYNQFGGYDGKMYLDKAKRELSKTLASQKKSGESVLVNVGVLKITAQKKPWYFSKKSYAKPDLVEQLFKSVLDNPNVTR